MSKIISHDILSDTLTLSECSDGFWLYDKTRSMNLSMRAKTATDAFVEAIEYYQGRLKNVEASYYALNKKVEAFVEDVTECEDF
jgi:hypothetical protein